MEAITILLAEDEALLLLDFEQTLNDAGFSVLAVTSGKRALEILTDTEIFIQAIVTDIRLKDYPDGWEIARVAREMDPEMPIVYVSGDSGPDWASRGVPNSIMLEKPFAMAQLVTAVAQLLNDRPVSAK
ncbi:response regulator [Ensifer sp. NPDC090286]|uniref:response regulator n=1 Tax=Ensifer sp. NPDC090286 TaxID=3363991 RepID=UPI00383A1258